MSKFPFDRHTLLAPFRLRKGCLRGTVLCAALAAAWTGSAYAQTVQERQEERGQKVEKTPMQQMQEERARRARDVEKEYEAAMKRSAMTPAPKVVVDPWGNVRPSASSGTDKK